MSNDQPDFRACARTSKRARPVGKKNPHLACRAAPEVGNAGPFDVARAWSDAGSRTRVLGSPLEPGRVDARRSRARPELVRGQLGRHRGPGPKPGSPALR